MIIDHAQYDWHKSSYSAEGGSQCVEAAVTTMAEAALFVRDSKQEEGPVFAVSAGAWSAFVSFAVSV